MLANSPILPAKKYELLAPDEVINGGDRTFIFDTECYYNYWLAAFKCTQTNRVIYVEKSPDTELNSQLLSFIMYRFKLVGFYSRAYDIPMMLVAMKGATTEKLKEVSDDIILNKLQAYEVEKKYQVQSPKINHVDIIEVAPLSASLKIYAGRIHCERMQDLPYPPDTVLTYEQACYTKDYCVNDLDNTHLLFDFLAPQFELREKLGSEYLRDLRSKSDAQIAETVITSELEKLGLQLKKPNLPEDYTFYYKMPDYIQFKTPALQELKELIAKIPFTLSAGGNPVFPQSLGELGAEYKNIKIVAKTKDGVKSHTIKVDVNGSTYTVALGGLHSCEENSFVSADENHYLIDRDVASYYPQIVLNLELFPDHLGREFLEVYRQIVTRRLLEKKRGNKGVSDSLKIVINGTFGKFGSKYSKMYSPDLLTQVTMTGQLSLLMFIEAVEMAGIPAVSANTDGVVMKCPKHLYNKLDETIMIWENATGFVTEETRYKGLFSRDVNNYIAVTEDNECKTKGVYSPVGSALNSPLSKNPEAYICSHAVQEFLCNQTPVEETILYCNDITKFVTVRTVKGGAQKDGVFLGKAIRWYYAIAEEGEINYALSGNKVPKSEGAKPLMVLPTVMPNDLDRDKYIHDAYEILYDIGFYKRPEQNTLFTL